MPNDAVLLQCRNLACGYSGKTVLSDLNFQIAEGEAVALLGPNGSGKSTLLKTIAKSLPALSGTIEVMGDDLKSLSYADAARIAFVPQEEHAVFDFIVREIVMMGRLAHSKSVFDTPEDEAVVRQAMEQADCAHLSDRSILELSAGEKQRVWLARALAQQGSLLLLDEPTSHLDVSHQLSLLSLVRTLREQGLAILIAVHDLNLAAYVANRGILLHENRAVLTAPMPELLESSMLEQVYGVQFERFRASHDHVRVMAKSLFTGFNR